MEDPTRPTRQIGQPPQTVAARQEAVLAADEADAALFEEIRRTRFWSYFGAAAAVAAAVIALIALVAALTRDEKSNNVSSPQLQGLRQDIGDLRSDITNLRSGADDTSQQAEDLSTRIEKVERTARQGAEVPDDIDQLNTELQDLTDRVDQIEQAQEEAASGGP